MELQQLTTIVKSMIEHNTEREVDASQEIIRNQIYQLTWKLNPIKLGES